MDDGHIAQLNYKKNLTTAFFWTRHKGLILCLALGLSIFILLRDLSYPINDITNATIQDILFFNASIFIHAIFFIAIIIAAYGLSLLHIENATARFIYKNTTQIYEEIAGGLGPKYSLKEIEAICLPNQSNAASKISLTFKDMIKDANNRNYQSVNHIVEYLQEKMDSSLYRLNSLQRVPVTLGILGTFIGIFLAISTLEDQLINLFTAQTEDISLGEKANVLGVALFGKLGIAFSTSISGLQVSLLIGLIGFYFSRKLDDCYETIEKCISSADMLLRNTNIEKDDRFINSIEALTDRIHQMESGIDQHAKLVSAKIEGIDKIITMQTQHTHSHIEDLTNKIETGLNRLNEVAGNVISFSQDLETTHKEFFLKINSILISYEELSAEAVKRIKTECESLLQDVNNNQVLLLESVSKSNNENEKHASEQLKEVQNLSASFFEGIKSSQVSFIEEIKQIYDLITIKGLGEQIKESTNDMAATFEQSLESTSTKFENAIFGLDSSISSIEITKSDKTAKLFDKQLAALENVLETQKKIESEHTNHLSQLVEELIAKLATNSSAIINSQNGATEKFNSTLSKNIELVKNVVEQLNAFRENNDQSSEHLMAKQKQFYDTITVNMQESESNWDKRYSELTELQIQNFEQLANILNTFDLDTNKLAEVLESNLSEPVSSVEHSVDQISELWHIAESRVIETLQKIEQNLTEINVAIEYTQSIEVPPNKHSKWQKIITILNTPITIKAIKTWGSSVYVQKK